MFASRESGAGAEGGELVADEVLKGLSEDLSQTEQEGGRECTH